MGLPERFRAACLIGPRQIEMRDLVLPEPGPGEMIVRIAVATTCGTDLKVFERGGHPRMLQVPTPFGHEGAGSVAAVGEGVEAWAPGQGVVVLNSASCGRCRYCSDGRENLCRDLCYLNGTFAEFLHVPARFVTRSTYPIPSGLAPEHACLTEPLACVLHGVGRCALSDRRDIVVLGGGPIGQLLLGVLSIDGHRVVLADPLEERRAIASQMGAVATADPGVDPQQDLLEFSGDELGFDLAIDATGQLAGWELATRCIRPGGQALFFGGCPPGSELALDTGRIHYDEITLKGTYHHRPAAATKALDLLAERALNVDLVLSREMPLEETEQALRSMARRESLKVVLRPAD